SLGLDTVQSLIEFNLSVVVIASLFSWTWTASTARWKKDWTLPSGVQRWRGGGIIAVNYEARAFGVTRNMRGMDAQAKCSEIRLVRADLSKYREAGKKVISAITEFQPGFILERASVDEAYMDITAVVNATVSQNVDLSDLPNTWIVGHEKDEVQDWLRSLNADDVRLALGAKIMEEVRQRVFDKTGYRCSAGIAHNKILAKISCGLHKPNQQTVLPHASVPILYESLKLKKLRGLGGKFGEEVCESLGITTAKDLASISLKTLQTFFDGKTSLWLYKLGQGLDDEPVKERELPKSIGCSKNFRGPKNRLDSLEKVQKWLKMLADELSERLIKDKESNARVARTLNVNLWLEGQSGSVSRGGPMGSYDAEGIAQRALILIQRLNRASDGSWKPAILLISLNAGKFEEGTDAHEASSSKDDSPKPFSNNNSAETLYYSNIDPSLLESLPLEIKAEIESEMKRQSSDKVDDTLAKPILSFLNSKKVKDASTELNNASTSNVLAPDIKSEIESEMDRINKESTQCSQCGLEHLDYHAAKKLQRDLQGSHLPMTKRKSTETSDSSTSKKQKNILSFFNKI
ncbi:DNA polymerase etalike, partial [Caligus rogercresseyi]